MESFFPRRLNIVNIEREPPGHRSPHRGVIADLKTQGFLAARGKADLTLVAAHWLAEVWAVSYPLRLRPNLVVGRFQAPAPDWWKTADLSLCGAQWSSEVAAVLLS
jgi:hypothetical protein